MGTGTSAVQTGAYYDALDRVVAQAVFTGTRAIPDSVSESDIGASDAQFAGFYTFDAAGRPSRNALYARESATSFQKIEDRVQTLSRAQRKLTETTHTAAGDLIRTTSFDALGRVVGDQDNALRKVTIAYKVPLRARGRGTRPGRQRDQANGEVDPSRRACRRVRR